LFFPRHGWLAQGLLAVGSGCVMRLTPHMRLTPLALLPAASECARGDQQYNS
jgi:hypothetical protein